MRLSGSDVRRWLGALPALSVGLALIWVSVVLVVQLGYASHLRRAREELFKAANYAIRDPVVEVDARFLPVVRAFMPGFENEYVLGFLREREGQGAGGNAQQHFDLLVRNALEAAGRHPFRRLGLVPAELSLRGFAAHVFVHAGWLHLLGTLVIFLLAAPLLEERWSRSVFALALVLFAALGGAAFCLAHPRSDRALLGGSALVAGLVAAAIVRFRKEKVDFLRWLAPFTEVELSAPAWTLGAVWLCHELFLWWVVPGALPGSLDNAVGYTAHATGAASGALLSLLVSRFHWEREASHPSPVFAASGKKAHARPLDLREVQRALERGDEDGAYAMLEAEVRRSARNREVVTSFWKLAVERGTPQEAAPAMLQLVREELRRGAAEVAVGLWRAVSERLPSVLLDAPSLLSLVPAIARTAGAESAVLALEQALDARNKGLTPAAAARAAQLAAEIEPELAVAAARRALRSKSLDDARRAELEVLVAELAPPDPAAGAEERAAPSVFFEESDRSAFGDIEDLSAPNDSFPDGAVTEAVPRGLGAQALQIEAAGQGQSEVAYARLRAVSVAGVRGLGPKPVVLVDLLVDGVGYEQPLGVIRLRSDRFSPQALVPGAGGDLDALRELVEQLLARGQAQPLPDAASAAAKPVRVFASLEAYHEQVLRVAGGKLG